MSKQTNILERHTVENEGTKQINAVSALLELDARIKTISLQIETIKEALAGFVNITEDLENRLNKINPKIDIVSMNEANQILKGKK